MKILYYSSHPTINYSAPSGPGTHIREVVRGFEQHGHQVIRLIKGGEEHSGNAQIQFKKNRIKRFIPSFVWQSLKDYKLKQFDRFSITELEQIIQQEQPDVIYERSYYLMSSGYTTAKKYGIPYYVEMNAPYPEEKIQMEGKSFYKASADRVELEQITAAQKVFVVSSALKEYIIQRTNCDDEKVIVTPNAVNEGHIQHHHQGVEQLRNQWGITSADKIIGFVGSIFPYHGVDLLLEAFESLIKQEANNYKLLVVGDGEILPKLKEYAANHLPAGRAIFTGNVPHAEVYSYIALMDVAVMARSNWYGSPVKIFEYGALKKPIIAPDVVPVRDVMQHGIHGLLIKDDKMELIKALQFFMTQPSEAEKMASTFYEKVMREHTWFHTASKILAEIK